MTTTTDTCSKIGAHYTIPRAMARALEGLCRKAAMVTGTYSLVYGRVHLRPDMGAESTNTKSLVRFALPAPCSPDAEEYCVAADALVNAARGKGPDLGVTYNPADSLTTIVSGGSVSTTKETDADAHYPDSDHILAFRPEQAALYIDLVELKRLVDCLVKGAEGRESNGALVAALHLSDRNSPLHLKGRKFEACIMPLTDVPDLKG